MPTASPNDTMLLDLRHQALDRLYPQSMRTGGGWPAQRRSKWKPSGGQRLAIDEFLDGLPEGAFSPKISNAHVAARTWIHLAATQAAGDLEMRRLAEQSLGASLQNSEDAAQRLAKQIVEFLDADHDWRVAPAFGYRASRMDYSRFNEVAKATHQALDIISNARDAAQKLAEFAAAQRARLIPGRAPGDVWRQGFVSTLCFGWRDLTGRDPTPDGGRFRGFVDACFESLKGNDYTTSRSGDENSWPHFPEWTGIIRTVVKDLKSRPAWDGLARYEHQIDPPGTSYRADSETLAERQARDTAKRDAELRALAEEPGFRELLDRELRKPPPK